MTDFSQATAEASAPEPQVADDGADDDFMADYRPWEVEAREDKAALRNTLSSVVQARDDERASADAWEDSRSARETLRARYPQGSLKDLVGIVEQYDAEFKRNPQGAAEKLARQFMAQPPRFDGSKEVQTKDRASIRDSIDMALRDVNDRTELADAMKKYGKDFGQVMKRIVELDAALSADPLGAAARLAAQHGLPVTPQQQQEMIAAAAQQQYRQSLSDGLDRVIASGKLPGLENLLHEVADIMESPGFRHSADPGDNLIRAYNQAMMGAAIAHGEASVKRAQAAASEKARKSISGGSKGGGTGHSAGPGVSARQALANRLGELR